MTLKEIAILWILEGLVARYGETPRKRLGIRVTFTPSAHRSKERGTRADSMTRKSFRALRILVFQQVRIVRGSECVNAHAVHAGNFQSLLMRQQILGFVFPGLVL